MAWLDDELDKMCREKQAISAMEKVGECLLVKVITYIYVRSST